MHPDKPDAKALIDEARRLDAAATPKPWTWDEDDPREVCHEDTIVAETCCCPPIAADGQFIAASRALVPALADELEAALARERSVQKTNETLATQRLAALDDLRVETAERTRGVLKALDWQRADNAKERAAHATTREQRDSYLEQAKAMHADGDAARSDRDAIKRAAQDFALAVEMARDWADAATYEEFCKAKAALRKALGQ